MTKKDFILIAAVLKESKPEYEIDIYENLQSIRTIINPAYTLWEGIVKSFATELQQTNQLFNKNRFIIACGLD